MKKLLVLFAVLAFAAPAVAGIDPGTNGIGVYFDLAGEINCATPPLYSPLNIYVLATNINEASGISGWEGHLYMDPPTLPTGPVSYTLAGSMPVNPLTPPDFQVGLGGGPMPYSPAMLLLTVSTFNIGTPIRFGLGPIITAASSFSPPRPGFAAGSDAARLIALKPSSNVPIVGANYGYWVASVNGGGGNCPVPNEESSWGNVKALYQ